MGYLNFSTELDISGSNKTMRACVRARARVCVPYPYGKSNYDSLK